jgi:hypothetical protein
MTVPPNNSLAGAPEVISPWAPFGLRGHRAKSCAATVSQGSVKNKNRTAHLGNACEILLTVPLLD